MNIELSTQTKGEIAECQIICALLKKGCDVFRSCSENCRTDLVFSFDNKLYKVQVKYSRYFPDRGIIIVPTRSIKNTNSVIKTYKGQVDYFGAYCPELNKCYLIPEEDIPPSGFSINIRIDPTKNKQNNKPNKIHWAEEYEL